MNWSKTNWNLVDMKKIKTTEKYSPEIQEILDKKPSWIIRHGLWITFVLFVIMTAIISLLTFQIFPHHD